MHDPMVVAFEIRRPWPRRPSRRLAASSPRWRIRYPWRKWWDIRPRVFMAFWTLAGREFHFPGMVTVWHVEPGGHDALTVCDRRGAWRWHVHHWRIQVHLLQKIKRFLFERCEECGHRFPWGYAPVAHQWDQPSAPWWRVTRRAYHFKCSDLVHARRTLGHDVELLGKLVDQLAAEIHRDRDAVVNQLTGHNTPPGWEFYLGHRLQSALGYERDDEYRLVKKPTIHAATVGEEAKTDA